MKTPAGIPAPPGAVLVLPAHRRQQLRSLASLLIDLIDVVEGMAPWDGDNDNEPGRARG